MFLVLAPVHEGEVQFLTDLTEKKRGGKRGGASCLWCCGGAGRAGAARLRPAFGRRRFDFGCHGCWVLTGSEASAESDLPSRSGATWTDGCLLCRRGRPHVFECAPSIQGRAAHCGRAARPPEQAKRGILQARLGATWPDGRMLCPRVGPTTILINLRKQGRAARPGCAARPPKQAKRDILQARLGATQLTHSGALWGRG